MLTSADDALPSQGSEFSDLALMLLESLPPKDRIVIQMMKLEDCSVEDIRQRTGWSATAIRVRAFRARRRLRQTFFHLKETKP